MSGKRQWNIPPHLQRVATLLCEMFYAQKSQWPRAEWNELPCKTLPFNTVAQNIHPVMLASLLFTDEKIFTVITPKPHRMTDCTYIHQARRKTSRETPAHTINVQSLRYSTSRRVTSGWHHTMESRLVLNINIFGLHQLLLTMFGHCFKLC